MPLPPKRHLAVQMAQCFVGVALAGIGFAVMIRCHLGLGPWEVLADGIHKQLDIAIGTAAIVVSGIAFALWIPLRQKVGIGTLVSIVVFGETTNVVLPHIPTPSSLWQQCLYLPVPVVLWALGIAVYISAGLGPGPRDGIMTALAGRGHSVRVVRTGIELLVLVVGFALGGSVGVGTVFFAFTIGPLIYWYLHRINATKLDWLQQQTQEIVTAEGVQLSARQHQLLRAPLPSDVNRSHRHRTWFIATVALAVTGVIISHYRDKLRRS